MPTPAERKALLFLAGVIVLGASVRVVRASRDDGGDDAATRQALAKQLAAVDSAHRVGEKAARERPRGRSATARSRPAKRNARRPADSTRSQPLPRADASPSVATAGPPPPVDLDVASQSEIETLPRIGPVLARRIVEDRSANGPFGSLDGFERVRGVGPAIAAAVRERVTFSGTARPSNAVVDHRLRSSPPPSKSPRRERRP